MWSWFLIFFAPAALAVTVPDEAATVQQALGMVGAGETIYIRPGTYEEGLTIQQDVNLVGLGHASEVKLRATAAMPLLVAAGGANVTVQNLSLQGVSNRVIEVNSSASLHLIDVECHDGQWNQPGGCVQVTNGSLSVEGGWMRDNASSLRGGHIAVQSGFLEVNGTRFTGGSASTAGSASTGDSMSTGGAIFLGPGVSATLIDARFEGNEADDLGGAIHGDGAIVTVQDSWFFDHTAERGGALAIEGGALDLVGGTFRENSAGESGGAIYSADAGLAVSSAIFLENAAQSGGGALHVHEGADPTVDSSWFHGNTGGHGGSGGALLFTGAARPKVVSSRFGENVARHQGGAIAFSDSDGTAQVQGAWFCRNRSTDSHGGALAVEQSPNFSLFRSVFLNNEAHHPGGAVYVRDSGNNNSAVNNSFLANHAGTSGVRHLYVSRSGLAANHNLFAWQGNNTAFRGSSRSEYTSSSDYDWYDSNGARTENVHVANERPEFDWQSSDPLLIAGQPDVIHCGLDLRPQPGSPLLDAGQNQRGIGAFVWDSGDPRWYQDQDGDGVSAHADCDDSDSTIHTTTNWYRDADGDGFGDPLEFRVGCVPPGVGWVLNDLDCDDTDPTVHEEQLLYLDGDGDGFGAGDGEWRCPEEGWVDNDLDCDDSDDEVFPGQIWTIDGDGDGYGAIGSEIVQCERPHQGVVLGDDCDDSDPAVNPGAPEICNGIDDNCNELIDDDDPTMDPEDATAWYEDWDQDGYGAGEPVRVCEGPPGWVDNNLDCDDKDELIGPPDAWWPDSDEDGFGAAEGVSVWACEKPDGYVGNHDDCDDQDGEVHPNTLWYADVDEDGFGDDLNVLQQCEAPEGYVRVAGDCDDSNPNVHPNATEVCNGIDDDCNDLIDDDDPDVDLTDAPTFFRDGDGDGYGDPSDAVQACAAPDGYVENADDCDDEDDEINPDEIDRCDGIDRDCDGVTQVGGPVQTWYLDADQDGYGDAGHPFSACYKPQGYVDNAYDCDDEDPEVNPDAIEVCDGIDNNCDGHTDIDAVDRTYFAPDDDGDGFGDDNEIDLFCEAPEGWVNQFGDCDDSNAAVHPGAIEVCNGVDDNCDGVTDLDAVDQEPWFIDADGDGWGDAEGTTVLACEPPDGYGPPGDCDDSDPDRHPDADEVCNGIDDNCDGLVDDEDSSLDLSSAETWCPDADGDGYGDPEAPIQACLAPEGHVADASDCDDTDETVYPGAPGWTMDCEFEGGLPDTPDEPPVEDGPSTSDSVGCGCDSGGTGGGMAWALSLALLAILRRQRSEAVA